MLKCIGCGAKITELDPRVKLVSLTARTIRRKDISFGIHEPTQQLRPYTVYTEHTYYPVKSGPCCSVCLVKPRRVPVWANGVIVRHEVTYPQPVGPLARQPNKAEHLRKDTIVTKDGVRIIHRS